MASTLTTAKKIGQAGLAQLGKLTRRTKHTDQLPGDATSKDYLRQRIKPDDSSSSSLYETSDLFDTLDLPHSSPKLKSSSMCDVSHSTPESPNAKEEEIINLTGQVKALLDALSLLKSLFCEETDLETEEVITLAQSRLSNVVRILKKVLTDYDTLNLTEVFQSASQLIAKVKVYPCHESGDLSSNLKAICEDIDQLALSFSASVSEYLMVSKPADEILSELSRSKSYNHLTMSSKDENVNEDPKSQLLEQDMDDILAQMDNGVDIALQRAKTWSKYVKDIMTYVERKSNYENDYAKSLTRLVNSLQASIIEQPYLPLQDEFSLSLRNDLKFASLRQSSSSSILSHKFIEPMSTCRSDHEKVRKFSKDQWNKELKRMEHAVTNLKNAKSMYIQRRQEYERACELSQKTETELVGQNTSAAISKIEKRKKGVEDAIHKAAEAETTYKSCVAEANYRQGEISRVRLEILTRLHQQIIFGDKVLKMITRDYYHLEHTTSLSIPSNYQKLYERCGLYDEGSEYSQLIVQLPTTPLTPIFSEQFVFEPFRSDRSVARKLSDQSTATNQTGDNSPLPSKGASKPLMRAWSHTMGSDSDSVSGSSNKSLESSPSASPLADVKTGIGRHSMSDVIEDDSSSSKLVIRSEHSSLKMRKEPNDFLGICKRLGNRRVTFGIDFAEQVQSLHTDIPPIISLCIKEIEGRGITIMGIYRVSGVKSKVEGLCQKFDLNGGVVDLSEENPVVISNVLKLYLRQLPEPLLTFALYPEFIRIAKDDMSHSEQQDDILNSLRECVKSLPQSNFRTCSLIIHHLRRVTEKSDENQMNSANLGIVFGPTLLRPSEGATSLAALVDTPHQSRAVDLLVTYAEEVFGAPEEITEPTVPNQKVPASLTPPCPPSPSSLTDDSLVSFVGQRTLRRSSSTPITDVIHSERFSSSSKTSIEGLSQISSMPGEVFSTNQSADSNEKNDTTKPSKCDVDTHSQLRPTTDESVVESKPPIDQRARLARSLEIKAKFLLGTPDDVADDASPTLTSDRSPSSCERERYPLYSDRSPSSSERERPSDKRHTDRPSLSPNLSKDARERPLSTSGNNSRTRLSYPSHSSINDKFSFKESEACETSILVAPSKCTLTAPRQYSGMSTSPVPAPKLILPSVSVSPVNQESSTSRSHRTLFVAPVTIRTSSSQPTNLHSSPLPLIDSDP